MENQLYLICNNCGMFETNPYDIGDLCICGGVFVEDGEFTTFLTYFDKLVERYEDWNENKRADGIIMHTDSINDFRRWVLGRRF